MDSNQKRSKVFYGWYVVGACVLITLYAGGIVQFGFTAIFKPIAEEFGWSYAQISLAGSLRGFEMGILAPLMGILVDRWGPRRLIFAGSIIVFLGFLLLSRVSSLAMFYGAFALIAVGYSTYTDAVVMTVVANWFRRKTGTAIGIVASGFALGGLLVPLVTKLIDVLQWRVAMLIAGLSILLVVLPLSLLVRHKPEHYGYQPDGAVSNSVGTSKVQILPPRTEVNIPVKQAIRSRVFWHVAVAAMCHAFVISAVVMHIMPYLSSLGIGRSISSLIALAVPLVSICGRLGSGWLSDRLGKRYVFAASYALITVGLFLLGYVTTGTIWLTVPFIIAFSLGWGGSVTTRISLLSEYFGRLRFGTILGITSGIMMVGNIAGAPLAGWVFDTWGSYRGAWLGYGALTTVGMVLVLTIPYPSSAIRTSD
ncbi:MAG: hypothetical protein HW402_759 [Dehalococcoidales bacterium]|nr:hypothetical protein [Dehalococcoidales bacterium]